MSALCLPAELALIHQAAFRESRAWSAIEFEQLLASKHCFCVGDSLGFAIGRVIADEAELITLAVLPDAQSKGRGRQVLHSYHAAARRKGARTSFLEVSARNTKAINLYRSEGYAESARRSNYYKMNDGSRCDALILTLDLSAQ